MVVVGGGAPGVLSWLVLLNVGCWRARHLVVGEVGDAIGDARHQQRLPQCGQRTSVKACGGGAARLGWGQAVMGVGARVGQAHQALPGIAVVEVRYLHPAPASALRAWHHALQPSKALETRMGGEVGQTSLRRWTRCLCRTARTSVS